MKMAPISFAVPGMLRNRTRLKAPATATPAPRLPLTIMMIICTTAGSSARVTTKPEEYLFSVLMYTKATARPINTEERRQMKNEYGVIEEASTDLKIAGIYNSSVFY